MAIYIRSRSEGLFVGEFLGLGFFESSKGEDISDKEEPIEFESRDEAQGFLDSWQGGPSDCFVSEEEL